MKKSLRRWSWLDMGKRIGMCNTDCKVNKTVRSTNLESNKLTRSRSIFEHHVKTCMQRTPLISPGRIIRQRLLRMHSANHRFKQPGLLSLQVVTLSALRERSLGALEGHTIAEAQEKCPNSASALLSGGLSSQILGGESTLDMCVRISGAIDQIVAAHPGERVIVVTHGGVISSLHLLATGQPPPTRILNCGIYTLQIPSVGRKYWVLIGQSWKQGECPQYLRNVGFQKSAFGGGSTSA
mmetsp:Transcript_10560/g.21977  ORF Transcript_10560/g.21977 Transcript_10560/m.21977 type:complete len:239 (-) Transcript_10560:276-992(-)